MNSWMQRVSPRPCCCAFISASGERQGKIQAPHKVPILPPRTEESVTGGRFHAASSQQLKCFQQPYLLGCVQPADCQNERKESKPVGDLVWDHVTRLGCASSAEPCLSESEIFMVSPTDPYFQRSVTHAGFVVS